MVRMISAAAGLAVVGTALAGVNWGLRWDVVDNSSADPATDPSGAAAWNSQSSWSTYDLILTGAANAGFNGINMGNAPDPGLTPYFLFTDAAAIFNYPPPGGGDVQSGFEGFFNLTRFDTYVDLGSLNPNGTAPGQIGVLGANLNGVAENVGGVDGLVVRGAWFEFPPNAAVLDGNGEAHIMRITVAGDPLRGTNGFSFLGGNGSSLELGTDSGLVVLAIENAVPTPGAVALLGLGGIAAIRRRR